MIMGTGQGFGVGGLINIVPILLIFAVFYFIVILPHKKQQRKKETMIKTLKKGDRIVTSGGIFGTVATVDDEAVSLKVAENTKIRVAKSAISGQVSGDGSITEVGK